MGKELRNSVSYREPLAIVGIGLRFPMDSNNTEEFWNNLINGTNGIIKVPKDRWNADFFTDKEINKLGKIAHSTGGFIKDIYGFDNEFFNLSPYTTQFTDPQQRLLLEVTFEALEDAGLRLKDIYGSETSVYVGGFHYDHYIMALKDSNRDRIGAPAPMGTSLTSLANRISYYFNLKGPSATVDTACSASIVAFHHACQSIWNDEAEMAISGGVNALLRPETSIELSKGGFLGPSGFCQSFDESADGYVRGEGAAIIIIKKLKSALENNDRIYSLIEGTALNHDGYKIEGYTVPSIQGQTKLLSTLYNKLGIIPTDIDYIECHGTGTKVGDPIEVNALGEIIGKNRINTCYIGSVKTNIGHLEGAAAIAGIIKGALIISNKKIPPNLHFKNPRNDLNLNEYHFKVPTEIIQLNKKDNKPILVGINSFGAGGTNGHVILSEFIPDNYFNKNNQINEINLNKNIYLFILTEKSDLALKLTIKKYINYLKETSNNLNDICYTLMKRKTLLSYQLLIIGYSKDEIIYLLEEFIQGKQHQQILYKQSNNEYNINGKLAFVYSGQGGQWIGMGKELINNIPLFKNIFYQIDKKFQLLSGWSLINQLNNINQLTSNINQTNIVQPLIMAIQISLTYLWKDYFGIIPNGVIGHSIGEVASAYASGAIDIDNAIFIIYQRSIIQAKLSGKGKMLAVGINEYQANQLIQKYNHQISIATMNGPRMLTIAGDSDILDIIAEDFQSKHIFNAFVKTQIPYHTYIIEQIKDEMIQSLSNIKTNKPIIDLYSTVYAEKSNGLDSYYWYENARKPVLFVQTIEKMINDGYKQFIEIGPHPVLISGIKQLFNDLQINDGLAICSTKRKSEISELFLNFGLYFIHNTINKQNPIDPIFNFENFLPNSKFVFDLPHNTWEHKTFSVENYQDKQERLAFKYNGGHPFLRKDYSFNSINTNQIWEANINISNANYLIDHVVNNAIVFPAMGYLELAFAVAYLQNQYNQISNCFLQDITFENAIILPEDKMESLITRLEIVSPERDFIIYTKSDQQENSNWNRHTTGKINITDQFQIIKRPIFSYIKNQFEDIDLVDIQEFYSFVDNNGLFYGKYFQCIKQLWYNDSKILSKVVLSEDIAHEAKQYHLHPALFDAAVHGIFVDNMKNGNNELYLPHSLERVCLHKKGYTTLYSYIEILNCDEKSTKSNIWIYNEDEELVAEFYGLIATNLSRIQSENTLEDTYEYQWIEKTFSYENDSNNINTIKTITMLSNLIILVDDMNNLIAEQISKYLLKNINYKFHHINIIDKENQLKDINFSNEYLTFIIYIPSLCKTSYEYLEWQNKALKYFNLVKLIIKNSNETNIELRLITQNSSNLLNNNLKENQIKLDHVLLCGMCRVIQNEYPNLNVKFIDITEYDFNSIDIIFNDLFSIKSNLQDNEIMFKNKIRYVRRLIRLNNENIDKLLTKQFNAIGSYYKLEQKEKGLIDSFIFRQMSLQNLKSNEVEISVHATGINFKDILNATGRLSAKAVQGSTAGNLLGLEVSGIIINKGNDVKQFNIGDEVLAPVANGFSGRVIIPYYVCIRKPTFLTHVQCATIPVAYVTAFYGLKYLARLTDEDTILIHSAAGGVGIACINVAKYFGAKIIATVGTNNKKEFLKKEFNIPEDHIFDSRSNHFYDNIMNITNGQGVDVIISFLTGTLLDQTIKCLNSYGRFIEIGKSSIYDNKPLSLERFGNNISYFVEDIDRLSYQKPKLYQQIVNELELLFENKYFKPIYHTEYSINNISLAFQSMIKGDHIGKLVVNMNNQIITALPEKDLILSNKGVFIITGGASGFGLTTAKWIVDKGCTQIVLVSRSGTKSKTDEDIIQDLRLKGIQIYLKKINIIFIDQVKQLFEDVNQNIGSIKGIIHAATTMHDQPIEKLSSELFLDVIQTKAIGALNLHIVSLNYTNTIEYFILYSSVSAVIGISAQINYVAANYFLDTLAQYRHEINLPALSINLGLLGEYAGLSKTRYDKRRVADILISQGFSKMPLHKVLHLLELSILHKTPSRVAAFCNWNQVKQSFPSITSDLRFYHLIHDLQTNGKSNLRKGLRDKIIDLKDNSEAIQLLKQEICFMFAKVLNLTGNHIDIDQSMDKLGFDSLSYTQVRTWIQKYLNINYPIIKLIKGASIQTLVQDLIQLIKLSSHTNDIQLNHNQQIILNQSFQNQTIIQITHSLNYSSEDQFKTKTNYSENKSLENQFKTKTNYSENESLEDQFKIKTNYSENKSLENQLKTKTNYSENESLEDQLKIVNVDFNEKSCEDKPKIERVDFDEKSCILKSIPDIVKPSISKSVNGILKSSISNIKEELINDKRIKLTNGIDHQSDNINKSINENNIRQPRSSLSLNNAHVLGIGTANPPIANYTKDVFKNIMPEYISLGISDVNREKVEKFYENCGIEKKYCHDDFSKKTFGENAKDEYYNSKYKRFVPDLAFKAASKAIEEWGGDVKTITHVISCSCTGVIIPDVNFLLIKQLGLSNTVERISVNLMGCFGGITTLKTAKAFALQNPKYRILMVCTEMSSIHYRPLLEIDSMLACAIFGDGSAAMIIGSNPTENERPLFEIIQTGAHHIPDTEDLMGWDLKSDAWLIGLSPLIPVVFADKSLEIIDTFIKESVPFPLSLDDCDWLMHPGGKNILLSLQETLNIPMEKNIPAWNILKNYGNMSSATILFVMDDARKYPPKEDFSMAVAFGPGLSVEIALMRKL